MINLRGSLIGLEKYKIEVHIPGEKINPYFWLEYESIDTICLMCHF